MKTNDAQMGPSVEQPEKLETVVSDCKSDNAARHPTSPSSSASQRDRECVGANEARSPHSHKDRQSKEVGKGIKTEQEKTKTRQRSTNIPSSSDDAGHDLVSLAAVPSERGATGRKKASVLGKSGGVAQDAQETPAAREPDTFEFSPWTGHTGSTDSNETKKASQISRAGVEGVAGFPVSNCEPKRPVETPQYGTSYVQNDSAAEVAPNKRENCGTAKQGSPMRHSAVPVAGVSTPTLPKQSAVPSTPPTATPRWNAIPTRELSDHE
ncbi:hypothetical protein MRX96_001144 [Rhipicephalus microplus]